MKYIIEWEETSRRRVVIDAPSLEHVIKQVKSEIDDGDYVFMDDSYEVDGGINWESFSIDGVWVQL